MSIEHFTKLVLRDVSTGAVETRISKLRNQEAKTDWNSQRTQHRNRRNEIDGKKTPENFKFFSKKTLTQLPRSQS